MEAERKVISLPSESLEAKRLGLIEAFKERKDILLEDLQEDFGGVVTDIRLHGSVLNPGRYGKDSDVDVAIIVTETNASLWMLRLHRALFGGGYPFHIRYRGVRVPLDPITMCEADWPAWQRGKTKQQRGLA